MIQAKGEFAEDFRATDFSLWERAMKSKKAALFFFSPQFFQHRKILERRNVTRD